MSEFRDEKKWYLAGITIDENCKCEICGKSMNDAKSMLILQGTNWIQDITVCGCHVGPGQLGELVELIDSTN